MEQDLKPKDDLLREIFADVRKDGFVPWINDEDSDDDHITVNEICIHGKSWMSYFLSKDSASDLWECDSSGEGDDFCWDCEPACDCGKPHTLCCPICSAPWPKFSEERLVEARKNKENLLNDTNCPKCGHAWTITTEEMERLDPERLKSGLKARRRHDTFNNESFRRFCERMDAIKEAMSRAYDPCPKDGCQADVNIIRLEDGKFAGTGGPIHMCDFHDLDKRFPGDFSIDATDLPDEPESITQPAQARPMRNGRPIGRNSECPCGSGKKYKRCCEKGSRNK